MMQKTGTIFRKERIIFIVNPVSGAGRIDHIESLIQHHFNSKNLVPAIIKTRYRGHAARITRKSIKQGIKVIVAVGGDGTINEIGSELVGKNVILGIIPHGSGNGLARHLGIPLRTEDALDLLTSGRIRKIDTGRINQKFFFCTCGTGFDARVGKIFDKLNGRGFINYVRTVIREFFNYQPKKYRIRIDGKKIKEKAFLVTIANAGQYGNNAYIAPGAKIDDGLLDICIFRPFPRFKSLFLGLRLFRGTINKSKYLEIYQGKKVIIQRNKKIRMHLDGEPVKMKNPVKITVLPGSLRVLTPV